jgi:arginine decarboxylase
MAINMFSTGYLPLVQRSQAESLYWAICMKLQKLVKTMDEVPEDLQHLDESLSDTYFCNFSLFQSVPDSWAIKQLFPIMPLHRLDERPDRRAIVVDLTCDSDGKVSEYVSSLEDRSHLPLHVLKKGEPYYLGIFLLGAYQDILGDAHNLFGRVSEVHVYADEEEPGNFWIEKIIPGIRVQDMLAQVQYFPNDLSRRMSEFVRRKIDSNEVRPNVGMRILDEYTERLNDTTYGATEPEQRE